MARAKREDEDDRPPICPNCGVTMGIAQGPDGATRYVCLECGYPENEEGPA